jgi:hypothetical protein
MHRLPGGPLIAPRIMTLRREVPGRREPRRGFHLMATWFRVSLIRTIRIPGDDQCLETVTKSPVKKKLVSWEVEQRLC